MREGLKCGCGYQRHFEKLLANVRNHLSMLDNLMKKQSSLGRGAAIAQISNALEMATDIADRYRPKPRVHRPRGEGRGE